MVNYTSDDKLRGQLSLWLALICVIQFALNLGPLLNQQIIDTPGFDHFSDNPSSPDFSRLDQTLTASNDNSSESSRSAASQERRPDIIAQSGEHRRKLRQKKSHTIEEVIGMSANQLLETHQFFPVYGYFTELGYTDTSAMPPELVANPITRFSSIAFSSAFDKSTRYVVTLDPGHGGTDPGAIGTQGELEKFLTLDITERVARLLESSPLVQVKTTRHDDTGYSRQGRVEKIKSLKSDLLVSLHFNHLPQSELTLVETFYAGPENILESLLGREQSFRQHAVSSLQSSKSLSYTGYSQRIAEILQQRIYGVVSRGNSRAIDAGVKKETLYILTQSQTPGALIELTCLSNSEEERRLKTTAYREELASAIAGGLLDYFIEFDRATGI